MSWHRTILFLSLACFKLLLTSCKHGGPPPVAMIHDSNVPIPKVYDINGKELVGYQGYSDGFIANVLKPCEEVVTLPSAGH